MVRSRSGACVASAVLVLTACGGDGSSEAVATLPLADPPGAPTDPEPAADLAPSQISASTVATPGTPGPCALADLEFWTAQVYVAERSADAVIRVRNTGEVWCETDISGSPSIDPAIEPDVWLEAGGWADLVVGQSGRDCLDPSIVTLAEVDVHGESVLVPTSAIATCLWQLTAFLPNDVAVQSCAQLDTALTDRFVLVRNAGASACVLGAHTAVDGPGASTTPPISGDLPEVADLAAGDVVAIPFAIDTTIDCDASSGPSTLTFDPTGPVPIPGLPCGAVLELGPPRPWYGTPNGPLAGLAPGSFDLDQALTLLDPFTSRP